MMETQHKPRLGVSACLLGHPVRFDGGHRRNAFLLDHCGDYFELQPVCPESELGLGTPRPVIQLRQFGRDEIRLVYSKMPHIELGPSMRAYARRRVESLAQLDGFVFKKDSPSCGMERVAVVNHDTGMRERKGTGVFAEVFMQRYPSVPVEEEGRLNDPALRENFLERVYAHYRWRRVQQARQPLEAFREFHTRYKLVLMARNNVAARRLGQYVAKLRRDNLVETMQAYFPLFMQAMAQIPSKGQHVNVLMHILGYFKNQLSGSEKAELLHWFETYRAQQVSRVTPLALLQHQFHRHPNPYLAQQYYFSPFPAELMHPV